MKLHKILQINPLEDLLEQDRVVRSRPSLAEPIHRLPEEKMKLHKILQINLLESLLEQDRRVSPYPYLAETIHRLREEKLTQRIGHPRL